MKAAHEALSHTEWLRDKLAHSAASTKPRVSHEQVMSEAQAIIERKRKAHADDTPT
jgi:DNA-damage-inducible protein J